MNYTVRYGHLESLPKVVVNALVQAGDKLCRMGSSGQSKHNHLHIDVVEGYITRIIRLAEIGYEEEAYKPNIIQLNYFIDRQLFHIEPVVTTPFYDPEYKELYGKNHPAYDLVPEDRHSTNSHYDIHWNRSKTGLILNKGFDDGGYGYYLLIGFEA